MSRLIQSWDVCFYYPRRCRAAFFGLHRRALFWEAVERMNCLFSFPLRHLRIPSSLKLYRIYKEEIVLISARKTSLQEIETLPWICYSTDSYIMRHSKKKPKQVIVVNNMNAVVEMVSRGLGVAMVPSHVIQDRKNLHTYPVTKFSKEYIYLVTRKYDRMPSALSDFIALIKKHASDWKEIQ